VALMWVESKMVHPILSRSLFGIRLFTLPILAAILLFAALFCLVFLMPFYLMHPRGLSVQMAGGIMSTLFFALFVISPVSGAMSDRIGSRLFCTIGMALLALALFSLAALQADASLWQIGLRLGLAGIGTALFIPPNSATAMSAVEPRMRGVASGTVAAARNLGMVLGVATAGAIFNNVFHQLSGGLSLKEYDPSMQTIFMQAFHHAMLAGAILAAVGMVVSFLRGPEEK
jgi:MFS family permease